MNTGLDTIAQGNSSRVVQPRRVLARTADEWRALWAAHSGPELPEPPVDFETRMIAGVFAGERPTSGFGVRITGTHRDGSSLVVDVVGFSDYTWIDNNAGIHTDALHVVERFRMIDRDTIEYRAVLEDPKAWIKPWNVAATLKRRPPTDALMEYNCAENNKPDDFPSSDTLLK